MENSHYQDELFLLVDLKVDAIREIFQEENTGVTVPDLGFEWVAMDTVYGFIDMIFKQAS